MKGSRHVLVAFNAAEIQGFLPKTVWPEESGGRHEGLRANLYVFVAELLNCSDQLLKQLFCFCYHMSHTRYNHSYILTGDIAMLCISAQKHMFYW